MAVEPVDGARRQVVRGARESTSATLSDTARLSALARIGLGAEPDPEMEAFARRVRELVGVPVALVSLVSPDEQMFPGMAGLPEPWASKRCTPLTHSFCRHVVAQAAPLVVEDARTHPLLRDNPAVSDLDVVAYAGMPLTDGDGNVVGSLCAIDDHPRRWTTGELTLLRLLAEGCATELRLRLARWRARTEEERSDRLAADLRHVLDRTRTMLTASQAFADTVTADDVRDRVSELVRTDLQPVYVGLSLLGDDQRMHRVPDTRLPRGIEDSGGWAFYDVETDLPTATATRTGKLVVYPDRDRYDADHGPAARQLMRDLGLHAILAAPLPGDHGPFGALALGWDHPRELDPADLLLVTAVAGYTAQALLRARRLAQRDSAAHQLQNALLTTLPRVHGLEIAARYQPADSRENVGGDWYDALPVPDPAGSGRTTVAVTVGDVTGHTLAAAAVMGQVRSMLRQAAWDHAGEPPSITLGAFERTAAGIGLPATGSVLLAHLERVNDRGWSMTWTNAGHPPPILLNPDGTTTLLDGHDVLFGYPDLLVVPRRDHHRTLAPGSTLLLYTDGLIERRDQDLDAGVDRLLWHLRAHRAEHPQALVDLLVDTLAPDSPDDVVLLAIRVPAPPRR